ncbi:MAG: porin [Bacteroidia bacterium]
MSTMLPAKKNMVLNTRRVLLIIVSLFLYGQTAFGQTNADTVKKETPKKWYETFSLRGYMQIRYNRLLETNPDLKCEQCDKSIGDNGGFFLRRARVVWSGQISNQVYFYLQPDFASSVSSNSLNFAQIRDAYFDLGVDKNNEFRFRVGQSKIPFGFENLQSSQNRLPLDRDDAINSAFSNERDLGVFFYWAPTKVRKLFHELVSEGLKGSGDYGVLGIGTFNGQTANKPDLNNNRHIVARLTYPVAIGSQIIEASVQGYTGRYIVGTDQLSAGVKGAERFQYTDERVAGSFILYPKPFGIQAEYNMGKGPEFNPATDSIETKDLHGGYVIVSYKTNLKKQIIIPFARWQYYKGGKKHELDARSYHVEEYEVGIEWQPVKQFEFTAMYTISSRRFEDYKKQDNLQEGSLLRLQAQINF